MKKISLSPRPALRVIALAVALVFIIAPACGAVEIARENLDYCNQISESYTLQAGAGTWGSNPVEIYFRGGIEYFDNFDTLYLGGLNPSECVDNPAINTSASTPFTVESGELSGTLHYNVHFKDNKPHSLQAWVTFDKFEPTGSGSRRYVLIYDHNAVHNLRIVGAKAISWPTSPFASFSASESAKGYPPFAGPYIVLYDEKFEHEYVITEQEHEYILEVNRHNYTSKIEISDVDYDYLQTPDIGVADFRREIPKITLNPPLTLNITDQNGKYFYRQFFTNVDPGDPGDPGTSPDNATVTVYVRNSQTGAAIANSNVVIDALVNGEYYPVANTTEPSGIFSITLQPTGGGQPNPDGYRLIATADGYNNPMPEINFTVTDSKKYIYCYLDPIAGGPENENNTFIDFYVRDLYANPVSGATVKFGKYTLITNSHGYTVFEVPKNVDYTYTVSKSGYGPVTGNANIGVNNRYIINAVIGPAVTPTAPTAIPTTTQTGPTPTLTAPTGEPVSNLLEWFAAHFGMILGGGVEIGKIFMWLCFTVPVGVYVGKEAKAGAAGFMAGAGIVTIFFVLIGWVPIWLLVLLALIIGLLYAKVFNTPDNGGGR